MPIELKIPEIGESINEVVIGDWLKNENDEVARDEDVVVIESDKATVEIPAPESGRLVKILKRSGATAAVGEAIGLLESKEPEPSESKEASNQNASASEPADKGEKKVTEQAQTREEKNRQQPEPESAERELRGDDGRAKRADTEGEEKSQEEGQEKVNEAKEVETKRPEAGDHEASEGKDEHREKQTVEDKEAMKESQETRPRPTIISRRKAPVDERAVEWEKPVAAMTDRGRREDSVVPMTPIRRRIAERLVQAQQTTAFLTTFNEIDMSAVQELRRRYQEDFEKSHDIKLGLMSFFVKASIEALKLIPQVNAEIRGTDIVYRNYYDIGVAVGGGKGLVVPILRNAEQMSFSEVEQAIQLLARKAERNQLKPDDLEGGTFTISNGGIYGSLLSTPIINTPQSGILGMHAVQERPVVRDGEVVVRPMMYVALTYDHRIVDGREAVTFLKRIKECVEAPPRILLEI